jgi:hypothetical protein
LSKVSLRYAFQSVCGVAPTSFDLADGQFDGTAGSPIWLLLLLLVTVAIFVGAVPISMAILLRTSSLVLLGALSRWMLALVNVKLPDVLAGSALCRVLELRQLRVDGCSLLSFLCFIKLDVRLDQRQPQRLAVILSFIHLCASSGSPQAQVVLVHR